MVIVLNGLRHFDDRFHSFGNPVSFQNRLNACLEEISLESHLLTYRRYDKDVIWHTTNLEIIFLLIANTQIQIPGYSPTGRVNSNFSRWHFAWLSPYRLHHLPIKFQMDHLKEMFNYPQGRISQNAILDTSCYQDKKLAN